MQIGVIFELMGERDKAGRFLSWGKAISCMQSLQPFVVAFSLALGMKLHLFIFLQFVYFP